MINKITLFFISLFLLVQCAWSMDFKNHPDYELILRMAELGDEMLTSGKIYFTLEFINVDSLSERSKLEFETKKLLLPEGAYTVEENYVKYHMLFMFKNNRIHLVEKAIRKVEKGIYLHYVETVYDGESTTKLRLDSLSAKKTIEAYGDIYEGNIIDYSSNPLWYGYLIGNLKIGSFLKGEPFLFYRQEKREKIKEIRLIKEENISGNNCIVIQELSKDTGNVITSWLDKEKLYRPVKIEMILADKKIIIENTLNKYREDLWFPEKITVKEFYQDEQTKKYNSDSQIILIISPKTKLNNKLFDSLFDTPIPDGATVGDHRTDSSYVKGMEN